MKTLLLAAALCSGLLTDSIAAEIPATRGGRQPQMACDGKGTVHLAYGQGNKILYVSTPDGGKTFSPPLVVATLKNLMLGMRRGPRIAVSGDTIVITAPAAELVSFTSTDGGKSWTQAAPVNDRPRAAREGLHNLAAIPGKGFYACWLDLRNGKTEIWGALSKDGATWTPNRAIYKSPDGSVCECCHPSVTANGKGDLLVMWRNSLDGSRDMYYARSSNQGASFGEAAKLGQSTWKLNACPMDGGAIALNEQGGFLAVWRREGEIAASAGGKESQVGSGAQPVVVLFHEIPFVAWSSDNQIFYRKGQDAAAVLGEGKYVALAADEAKGEVFAAWEGSSEEFPLQFGKIAAP